MDSTTAAAQSPIARETLHKAGIAPADMNDAVRAVERTLAYSREQASEERARAAAEYVGTFAAMTGLRGDQLLLSANLLLSAAQVLR